MTLTAEDYAEKFTVTRETKVCNRCDAVLREAAPHCGICEGELLEATLRDLTAPAPASTLAIWELRDRGLTARQVMCICRELKRGRKPYEVVTVIEGLANWRCAA